MKKFLLLSFMLMFAFTISDSWAQERTVSGKVTSIEDGSGLPGVNVILKGTTSGTVTDIDGNFKLSVPSDGGTLVFSFIGLATEEVAIGARSVIDIQLSPDVKQLSEIVVTAVGIEQNKRALGYSVQNVKADDIVNARETNIVNALNSKVAGVTVVSSSGSPGASSNIRIRGNTSINGSNSPLFVVDGVPIDNSSGGLGNGTAGVDNSNRAIDINSNDVESLTVLKGAAATALYGVRAANGAIIITTKRGKSGKTRVSFNTSFTADKVNKLPDFQTTYAQGRPVGGVNTWRGPHTLEGNSYGPAIADLEYDGSDYPYDKNGMLVPKGTGNGIPARGINNAENFFETGLTWDKNLSVSGGNEKSTYYLSVGNLKTSGIVPNSEWERTTAKVTVDTKINDKFSTGMSATVSNTGGSRLQRGSNISGVALGLYRNSPSFDAGNGKTGQAAADDPTTYELPDGTQRSYRAGVYDSPYWTVSKNVFDDDVNRVIGNINLAYDITPWLKATYKIGMDHYTDRTKGFADVNSASFKTGSIWNVDINSTDLNSDLLFIVNKDINEDLNISAVFGHNYYTYDYYTNVSTGTDFGSPGFQNISNASNVVATEGVARKKINGILGDIKFDYRNMLFVNFTGRNDWSSTLPDDNNSFFYPAVALGFDFTEAFGIANGKILSYGKLRGSWGQVGNDAPIFVTTSYFNSAAAGGDGFIGAVGFPAFGTNAFERSNTLGNDKLKAELTTTYEFGAELKFFNGRLEFDYTYYNKTTVDQIINVNISNTTGFGGSIQNAGTIENKGHELLITGNPVKMGDFSWDVEVNFTKYTNMVKELAPGTDRIFLAGFTSASSNVIAGEPYGVLYGNAFLRNDEGKMVIGSNGWPLVDPAGDKALGDPNPDWIAGIRNTFSYKGLSLSALLDIRQGGEIWNGTQGILNTFGTSQVSADLRETRGYVFDGVLADGNGDATTTPNNIPVDFANPATTAVSGNRWNRYGFGGLVEENIQDGSWIRLRQVTLAYQIPSSILEKLKISSATFSISGRNLWLKTEYTGIDPETNLTGASNGIGLEYFNMPNTKSYGASLSVTF